MPISRHDRVAQHLLVSQTKLRGAVRHEAVQLLEGAGVDQQREALARGELPLLVLLGYAPLAAPDKCLGAELLKLFEAGLLLLFHRRTLVILRVCPRKEAQ